MVREMVRYGLQPVQVQRLSAKGWLPIRPDFVVDKLSIERIGDKLSIMMEHEETLPPKVADLYKVYIMSGAPIQIMSHMDVMTVDSAIDRILGGESRSIVGHTGMKEDLHSFALRSIAVRPAHFSSAMDRLSMIEHPDQLELMVCPVSS